MIKIKLSRNPEVNRLLVLFAFLLAGLLIAALLLGLAGRYHLKQALIESHASILGAITEKYPEAEQDLINRIMHPDKENPSREEKILSKYGIDSDGPARSPLMQKLFRYNLVIVCCCPFSPAAPFTTVLPFLKKQQAKSTRDHRYAGKINLGPLSISGITARAISILKNEIYKITTLLKEQAGALQRDRALLADSLADISHQLKTPLTSLSVLNDLLSDNPAEEKRALFLERMRAQLKRIEWLVSSLLKLSRLDAGAVTMKKERIRFTPSWKALLRWASHWRSKCCRSPGRR